ncbi:MAG TPA: FliH/SctL family protein [Symbiobacteriaceae bacterium]
MSSFKAGILPAGVTVHHPEWPTFRPDIQADSAAPAQPAAPAATDGDAILRAARLQAAELLQKAAEEAEAAVAEARRQGFEAGREEGLAAARSELEAERQAARFAVEKAKLEADALRQAAEADARAIRAEAEAERQRLLAEAREQAARLLEEARAERDRVLEASRDALVELAVAAATRLVQGHLAVEPEAIVNMVAAGLRRLRDTDCTVRVSPADLPLLDAQRARLERELGEGTLLVQPDAGLSRGSFLIHSPQGSIDGTLEAQTARLRDAMTAALGRE